MKIKKIKCVYKSKKSFKEKIVATTSIISDMKQSDKNRQVIAGFGTQSHC